ncbi:MAG TPA: CAP domain-containing protein [Ornithinibacter sp.]|nr:CAP domain-containing protein [Ornithinibacter sp.]
MSPHEPPSRPRSSPAALRRRLPVPVLAAAVVAALALPAPAQAVTTGATWTPKPRAAAVRHQATTFPWVRTKPSWRPTRPGPVWTAGDPLQAEVVRLVNLARADAGCSPVRVDSRLTTAARLHSEDMARQAYFSHTSLDGRTPWDRMRAQGYTSGSAENIAAGQKTAAAVMTAWMNSPGHRANILACSSRGIGVGVGYGGPYGTYWTQDFGRD